MNDADVIRAKNEAKRDTRDFKILIFLGVLMLVLAGFSFFASMHEEKQNEGKINAGYYDDLIGEDYKTVEAHFKAAGFNNVELVDLNDAGVAFWTEGEVSAISIGGNMEFDTNDWFDPDTKVVISYH